MLYEGFSPSAAYRAFKEEHGEDAYNLVGLLYIASELDDLYDADTDDGEFDELCELVLDLYLDEIFEAYDIVDVTEAVRYIIGDSNYTVKSYVARWRRDREAVAEEALALLEREVGAFDDAADEYEDEEE